jgi:hypothetical protein
MLSSRRSSNLKKTVIILEATKPHPQPQCPLEYQTALPRRIMKKRGLSNRRPNKPLLVMKAKQL